MAALLAPCVGWCPSDRSFHSCLAVQAGQRLVVLEVESSEQCDTGLAEEAELHWKEDKQAALAPCSGLKHLLQRTARDCPDVKFLTLEVTVMGFSMPELLVVWLFLTFRSAVGRHTGGAGSL